MFCRNAFDDWPRVDVSASFERFCELRAHGSNERIQFFAQDLMVVVAPGIARNPSSRRFTGLSGAFCGVRLVCVVAEGNNNQAAQALQRELWVGAARVVEILHLAGVSAAQPFLQVRESGELLGNGDAAKIESNGSRTVANPLSFFGGSHAP